MIIPVRCFGCGKVLADKWDAYVARCKAAGGDEGEGQNEVGLVRSRQAQAHVRRDTRQKTASVASGGGGVGGDGAPRTVRGRVLDEMGITNSCCRTVMLTNVDLSTLL